MNENDTGKPLLNMPEKVRLIIQRETEDGLRRFRAGNFDSRLESFRRSRPEGKRFFFGLPKWAWIPALGFTIAGILVIMDVLWFGRTRPVFPPAEIGTIDAALISLPGFRTLSIPGPTETAAEEDLFPAAIIVSRALAIAARNAAERRETVVPPADKLVPRYSLEQKIKILFGDKTIERAFSLFKDKFKEV